MTPQWVPAALSVQLVLVFFAPPVPLANRTLFVSDLWCLLWVAFGLWDLFKNRKRCKNELGPLLSFFAASAFLLVLAYTHGFFRPPLEEVLVRNYLFRLVETDAFKPGRELVVCLRFLSWAWACGLTGWWFSTEKSKASALDPVFDALFFCLCAVVALMAAERFSVHFLKGLSEIYLFDPFLDQWKNRAHGPFRSPVEAAAALVLSGILLVLWSRTAQWKKGISAGCVILGIALTKTVTPLLGVVGASAYFAGERLYRRKKWEVFFSGLFILTVAWLLLAEIDFIKGKVGDFSHRLGLWQIYFKMLASRFDHLLLGFGFAPYHSDNFYVFLLLRGGALLLLSSLWFAFRQAWKNWRSWGCLEKTIVIYFLITSAALDVLIYRHIAALAVALAVPILALERKRVH